VHPEDSTPPPFFRAYATGSARRAQLWLAGGRAALALLTAGAYFLSWHVVHATSAGEGIACLFSPDCHPGPSEPAHDTGASFVCTGYSHHHGAVVVPLLAVALAAVALLGLRRSRLSLTLLLEVAGLGLCGGIVYGLFEMFEHMFDRIEPLWGERLFNVGLLLLVLSYVLGPAAHCLLIARGRRDAAGAEAPRSVDA
jgi:hypothetical protein